MIAPFHFIFPSPSTSLERLTLDLCGALVTLLRAASHPPSSAPSLLSSTTSPPTSPPVSSPSSPEKRPRSLRSCLLELKTEIDCFLSREEERDAQGKDEKQQQKQGPSLTNCRRTVEEKKECLGGDRKELGGSSAAADSPSGLPSSSLHVSPPSSAVIKVLPYPAPAALVLGNLPTMEREGLGVQQAKAAGTSNAAAAERRRVSNGTPLAPFSSSSSAPSPSPSSSQPMQRHAKRRSLIALSPFIELTERESTETIMTRLLGQKVSDAWFRRKRIMMPLTLSVVVLYQVFAILAILLDMGELVNLCLSSSCLLCGLYLCLQQSSIMNMQLFLRSLEIYDTIYFLVENFLFCLSLWTLLCKTLSAAFTCVSLFLCLCMVFLFYDSFPVTARRGLRLSLYADFLFSIAIFTILYVRAPQTMCYHRMDWLQGLIEDQDALSTKKDPSKGFSLSFSLTEFCLNRGFTLLLLHFRITLSLFKHPEDCVILKSRMKLIETPLLPPPLPIAPPSSSLKAPQRRPSSPASSSSTVAGSPATSPQQRQGKPT